MSRSAKLKNKWSSLKRQLSFSGGEQPCFLSNEASPEFCVRLLKSPTVQNYHGIREKLKSSSSDWMSEFLESDGMEVLLGALERLSSKKLFVNAVMLLECTCCIKTVLNSKAGLEFMIGNREFTRRLGRGTLLCINFPEAYLISLWLLRRLVYRTFMSRTQIREYIFL